MDILTKNETINLWTINRPRTTCKWSTKYCQRFCYNKRVERVFAHSVKSRDIINEKIWQDLTGSQLHERLSHIRTIKRIRLMTRGEAFTNLTDVLKVKNLCRYNTDWTFIIPTRAWRNKHLKHLIEMHIQSLPNARLYASIDPSNTLLEINDLIISGWSTAFFGEQSLDFMPNPIKCPKTFNKQVEIKCSNCNICFDPTRKDVQFKKH